MANSNQPPKKVVPFPIQGKRGDNLAPAKPSHIPEELKQLDGAPIASVQPENNAVPMSGVKVVRSQETANNIEFNLFEDGALMRYILRPGFEPQCLLVDGVGRQFGVVRNEDVANLVCNGVNAMHLARTMMEAEDKAKQAEANPGGPPPALLLPPTPNV